MTAALAVSGILVLAMIAAAVLAAIVLPASARIPARGARSGAGAGNLGPFGLMVVTVS